MTLLFDTSAVVSLVERASPPAVDLVRSAGDRPFVSFVTIAELHVGVGVSPDPSSRAVRERTLRRARTFRQLPLDESVLDHYAHARQSRLRGNDAWIVAAAMHVEATLVTTDEVLAQGADGLVGVRLIRA